MLRLLTLVATLSLSLPLFAAGQAGYISDNVFIYLQGGPGTQYRIVGSIEAGQPVTVLPESQDGYTKIIDHKGREGWVQTDMLTSSKSFRETLPLLQAELADTQARLDEFLNSTESSVAELAKARTQLEVTEASLKNAEKERDEALNKLSSVQENERYVMWKEGGLIAGLGILVGIILVYIPRPQRRKKNRWM